MGFRGLEYNRQSYHKTAQLNTAQFEKVQKAFTNVLRGLERGLTPR